MFRIPARLLLIGLAAATICGGLAAAGASEASTSVHGNEHVTFASSSAKSSMYSVIATGAFTDGGSINLAANTGLMKLGAGTVTLKPKFGKMSQHFSKRTCLLNVTGHGTYKVVKGSGKYAGITGSGSFSYVSTQVNARKASGACGSRPLAMQATFNLRGPVTLGG